MTKKVQKKQRNKFLVLTGVAVQMGVTIYLMIYIGKWLDIKYQRDFKLFTMLFTIVGVGISLYSVNKQLQRINN